MVDQRTIDAVEGSDTDALLRIVDGHCASMAWDRLGEVRLLLTDAIARGKQLWGVDEHIRYRLALEAPAELAAAAVAEGPARFSLGPLTEVVATTHTFSELSPWLERGPVRTWVAQERVLRREDIDPLQIESGAIDLPLLLEPWETAYPEVVYKKDRVESEPPPLPPLSPLELPSEAEMVDDPAGTTALNALVATWVEESNGRAITVCAAGDVADAVRLLGVRRALSARIDLAMAAGWMAWAAASSGAHGRRKGGAAGRQAAWWALTELTSSDWPPDPAHLRAAANALECWVWSDLTAGTGWNLSLAFRSPSEGLTWAIAATDAV
ncbi:MAG TPA: hypothetical protein VFY46_07320 [Acidimicrobiia bacterium]|nr:hypothetical protein [Acidimicrobiia bacterium]